MAVTLKNLSDFKYKKVGETFKLEFGGENSDLTISDKWHKLTGTLTETGATLTIEEVDTPSGANFFTRIETDFHTVGNSNRPWYNLVAQNNTQGSQTLYAFIGNDDDDMQRTHYSGSFLEISNGFEVYFTVQNGTFKFYYFSKPK